MNKSLPDLIFRDIFILISKHCDLLQVYFMKLRKIKMPQGDGNARLYYCILVENFLDSWPDMCLLKFSEQFTVLKYIFGIKLLFFSFYENNGINIL
jgi:hypothetical protein